MSEKKERAIMAKLNSINLNVDVNSVLKDAQNAGIDVSSVRCFQNQITKYWRIEDLMESYAGVAARYSAISGASTGAGGVGTKLALGGVDIAHMAAQLYRLGQRLAILNGIDPRNERQKEKITEIYLYALGFDAAAQAVIKSQLLKASAIAGKSGANNNPVLRLIILVAEKLGTEINTKKAAQFIPIVGLFAGAGANYAFAKVAANKMIKTYKNDYFRSWQATHS
jgi:hypothetical protein|tara:strand:- start:2157 stop:2831 length:675 start_codon:yes stop_codon:yes gene_type:complete